MIDTPDQQPLLLRMENVDKAFPGVRALHRAKLELQSGEVLALMGENGAGKSTLVKTLSGAYRPDAGSIHINGKPASINTPQDAQRHGVAVIYQEFNLVPTLTARENIFLGQERARLGFFSRREERERANALFARIGVKIKPDTLVSNLPVAQQQIVEIAKALSLDARIIVMDEPSAALTVQEVENLFKVIAELKEQGIGIVYVSHRLEEVFRIADRITVMRDGETIETRPANAFSRKSLIEAMVGRKLENEFPKAPARQGAPRLEVTGLQRGDVVRNVSFQVRAGEILGLTGLVGAGRTETARLIFGADRRDGGKIAVNGKEVDIRSPRDAIRNGICLLTEDRKAQGLVLGLSARENFALPNLKRWSRGGVVRRRDERTAFLQYIRDLRIKVSGPEQRAGNLSGGNQQKVVLAKWLESDSDVIIFDEPTRGIDVGAKYEIYLLMNRLAEQGKAIVMISSELPEVLGMSDRILVMHEGSISGEITDVHQATQAQIMMLAVGQNVNHEASRS